MYSPRYLRGLTNKELKEIEPDADAAKEHRRREKRKAKKVARSSM